MITILLFIPELQALEGEEEDDAGAYFSILGESVLDGQHRDFGEVDDHNTE